MPACFRELLGRTGEELSPKFPEREHNAIQTRSTRIFPDRERFATGIGYTLVCTTVRPERRGRKKNRTKTKRIAQFVQFRIGATGDQKNE